MLLWRFMKIVNCVWLLPLLLMFVYILCAMGCIFFTKKGFSKNDACPIKIVAHRASCGSPENSLSAIEASVRMGVDMIELDVRITGDGELVVCHDENIRRVTNGSGNIADMSLEEIKRYRMRGDDDFLLEESVPTLGEVFGLVAGRTPLLLDVKRTADAERMAKALINEIALYGAFSWVTVQSSDDDFLWHMYRLGNPCRLEKLIYFKFPGLPLIYDGCITLFNLNKYDYISSFNVDARFLTSSFVDILYSQGKEVKMWTVGTPDETPSIKVDGVITDVPEAWLQLKR